jgi:hypothetical protein
MNSARRKVIAGIQGKLEEYRSMIEELQSEEQEAYDNLPEGLQSGERGEKLIASADALQEALDYIESVTAALEEAVQ